MILQFHPSLAGCAKLERRFPVLVGDEEVGLGDDVHANEDVVVVEVGAIDFDVALQLAVGEADMNEVSVRLLVAADAHERFLSVGLEAEGLDDAGRNERKLWPVSHAALSV